MSNLIFWRLRLEFSALADDLESQYLKQGRCTIQYGTSRHKTQFFIYFPTQKDSTANSPCTVYVLNLLNLFKLLSKIKKTLKTLNFRGK